MKAGNQAFEGMVASVVVERTRPGFHVEPQHIGVLQSFVISDHSKMIQNAQKCGKTLW